MQHYSKHFQRLWENRLRASSKNTDESWAQWLMPIILATQEMEIGQSRQKVHETPSQLTKSDHSGVCLSFQILEKHT
jgi:hypothetical protein